MKSRYEFSTEQEWLEYLRFYYAGMAMQGYCVSKPTVGDKAIAGWSVDIADALIEALNKTEK